MKRYELLGRLVFEADDIVDAYIRLGEHFTALAHGHESSVALTESHVKIRPVAMSGGFPAVEAPTQPCLPPPPPPSSEKE